MTTRNKHRFALYAIFIPIITVCIRIIDESGGFGLTMGWIYSLILALLLTAIIVHVADAISPL